MTLPNGDTKTAREFARVVIRRRWLELPSLFASAVQPMHTPQSLESEFGWARLGPRLRQMHIAATGELAEDVPDLDPPKRYELFEVEEREAPSGHAPTVPVHWIEVDYQPAEDSEFDVCFNCFLAFFDKSGPRVAAYAIESAPE